MVHSSHTLGAWAPPSEDPRWELVLRIADSRPFEKAPKLREFLLYVCQKSLQDQLGELREPRIGHNVFGRREDYNAGDDNIVRVEARLLRKRLQEYFENEGAQEQLILAIPKGGYAPRFEPRESPAAMVEGLPSGKLVSGNPTVVEASVPVQALPRERAWRPGGTVAALAAVALVLAASVAVETWMLLRPA